MTIHKNILLTCKINEIQKLGQKMVKKLAKIGMNGFFTDYIMYFRIIFYCLNSSTTVGGYVMCCCRFAKDQKYHHWYIN